MAEKQGTDNEIQQRFPNFCGHGTLFISVNIYGTQIYVVWSLIYHTKVDANRCY